MIRLDTTSGGQRGFALLGVIVLAAFLMFILGAYYFMTSVERTTSRASMDATRGFYAAEAGLNVRFNQLRETFEGYSQPAGVSPAPLVDQLECVGGSLGSGDFACVEYAIEGRDVLTYVDEQPDSPNTIIIPRGELYQNLRALEYTYDIRSATTSDRERAEALLQMRVRSRLVPLFQFAAFYSKDLEILPGPAMTFDGPVHANGDIYLGAGTSLTINGQLTMSGRLFNGRKEADCCPTDELWVYDPASPRELPYSGTGRVEIPETDLVPWNGLIRTGVDESEVPLPDELDPVPGATYWDNADLRVMLNLTGATPVVEVRDVTNAVDTIATSLLAGCTDTALHGDTFHNQRESSTIEMLDIDVAGLLDCIHDDNNLMGGSGIDDATQGGLVWYFGVDGSDSDTVNNYGVRVREGRELASSTVGAPTVRGLTVVTNQAMYIEGDFNAVAKKPAAFLTDSLNVLSNAWDDSNSLSTLASGDRDAADTAINAAFLAGTDTTGGADGDPGQDSGDYNGGLENYPRFHEDWSGTTLTYRGSFVSLNEPRHVDGSWGDQSYSPPIRDWGFDTDFNDPTRLPPLSPRFVYLRQDMFVREYDL